MSHAWFWTFWHWSIEAHRAGALLDGPVHGIAGHWDEWYRHEASAADRQAIDAAGRSPDAQRRFVAWLARRWAAEATWGGARPPVRFVLGQLAGMAPFDGWCALARHRAAWHVPGVSAVVLAEDSAGAPADVRPVEALCIPADPGAPAAAVVAEGFGADAAELRAARAAVDDLLGGRSLALLLATWVATGRRPYPRPLGAALAAGWLVVAGLIAWLLVGPDPGARLRDVVAVLAVLWAALVATAATAATVVAVDARRQALAWRRQLARSQLRLRMAGGLTLIGGSAGLAFAINALLGVMRAAPRAPVRSWLWRRVGVALRTNAPSWAATGVIAADGRVQPVVLAPKLRAALQHPGIGDLLTPWQRDARRRVMAPMAEALVDAPARAPAHAAAPRPSPFLPHVRVGFATGRDALRGHRCRHLVHAVLAIAGLRSAPQAAVNALAVAASVVMLLALPDLRGTLRPPAVPTVVAPTSSSPYFLWVSLDASRPGDFLVALESDFWVNRRVRVARQGGERPSLRAEIPLARRRSRLPPEVEHGTVWVERRHAFLFRQFAPGARVGRYSLSWVTRLDD